MEELNKITFDIPLHAAVVYPNSLLEECYPNNGKCRKDSTPYASKRKKKRKK